MDDETRQALAGISDLIGGVAGDVRDVRHVVGDVMQAQRETMRRVMTVEERTGKIEKQVFGSNPPPQAPMPAILARQSESEAEQDAMQGQLIAVEARLAKVEGLNEKQSAVMGIPTQAEPTTAQTVLAFVKSREGRKLLVALATFAFAAVGARAASSTQAHVEHAPVVVVAQDGGK